MWHVCGSTYTDPLPISKIWSLLLDGRGFWEKREKESPLVKGGPLKVCFRFFLLTHVMRTAAF
jgi:hypothetical protein